MAVVCRPDRNPDAYDERPGDRLFRPRPSPRRGRVVSRSCRIVSPDDAHGAPFGEATSAVLACLAPLSPGSQVGSDGVGKERQEVVVAGQPGATSQPGSLASTWGHPRMSVIGRITASLRPHQTLAFPECCAIRVPLKQIRQKSVKNVLTGRRATIEF